MTAFDFDRPFIGSSALSWFRALDHETAARYGAKIQAASMANFEYAARHARFSKSTNMRPPPSIGRKFPGYLVVRRVGQRDQYETWMPETLFEELYAPVESPTGEPGSNPANANDA